MSEEQHALEEPDGDVEDIVTGQVDEDIKDGDHKKGRLVTVTVDTKPHTVRKGRYIATSSASSASTRATNSMKS